MSTLEFNSQMISYENQLNNFAYKLTSNYDDAKDLLQETYIKAIRYKDTFTDQTNLKAWLFTIMKNTFINSYRKSLRTGKVINGHVTTDSDRIHQKAENHTIETSLYADDIHKAISTLAPEYRTPFEMYVEGYKYKEIAEHMGLPLGSVKSRIHIARQDLMSKIKRR